MKDEELLQRLGDLARDEDAADPLDARWDRLAADDLSAEERAELERLAEESEVAEAALGAFSPLDDELLDRIAERVVEERGARVIPFRKRSLVRWGAVAVPLLAAAAVALLVVLPSGVAPLPDYGIEVGGGDRAVRSGGPVPGGTPRLSPTSHFDLVLRPSTAVVGPVEVAGWLLVAGGPTPLPLHGHLSEGGAARLGGGAVELFGAAPGEREIIIVVARPGLGPDEAALSSLLRSGTTRGEGWRLFRTRVQITEP